MLSSTESAAATAILARIIQLAPVASAGDLLNLSNAGSNITNAWEGNWNNRTPVVEATPDKRGTTETVFTQTIAEGIVPNKEPYPTQAEAAAPAPEPTKRTRRTKEQIAADEAAAKAATTTTTTPEPEAVEVTLKLVDDEAQPEEEATPEPEAAKEGPTYADKINSAKATFLQKSKVLGETDPAKQASFKASVTKFYTDLGKARISEIPEEHIDRFISEMVNKF